MSRRIPAILALAIVLAATPLPVAAADPPLVDAGLDQTVARATTVYLDATGTTDPDGTIETYTWTISAPDGTTSTPDCAHCGRTAFTPTRVGTYAATVTATDDDGNSRTDTLYVHVTPGDPPTLALAGPTTTRTGDTERFRTTVTAGTAPLDTLTWRVDGHTVRTTALDERTARDTLDRAFTTAGDHTVTARVTDTDGLTRERTIQLTASPPASSPSTGPSSSVTLDPTVRGPRVVTGTQPLTATYRVTDADRATWWLDGARTHQDDTATRLTLSPGDHDLYATTDTTTATFPDGTTHVVADPEPVLHTVNVSGHGGLHVTTTAADAYHNLASLTVTIDNTTALHKRATDRERFRNGGTNHLHVDRDLDTTPGTHTIRLTATDARGQTTTTQRTVDVAGPPEIVSARFTNTPVRAYDPRWSPDNYAAHHVIIVDPNGLSPEQITVDYTQKSKLHRVSPLPDVIDRRGTNPEYVYFDSYWGREGVGKSRLNATVHSTAGSESTGSELETQPSDPVIQLNVTFGGVNDRANDWGIIVDAGQSFDPDGTRLEYDWSDTVSPFGENDRFGKFDSMTLANLVIKDGNHGISEPIYDFLDYYAPRISKIEPIGTGPYGPNETVQFHVQTKRFMLTKSWYADKLDIELRTDNRQVSVDSWEQGRDEPHSVNGIVYNRTAWYQGSVSVNTSTLLEYTPSISVVNNNHSSLVRNTRLLPGVNVTRPSESEVLDVDVLSRSFLVEDPVFDTRRTKYPAERDDLLKAGYGVTAARNSGWKYELEHRVKVRDAQYRSDEQRFRQPGYRSTFLQNNPSWEAGATETSTRRWTTTEHEWRSAKSGRGEFTGETRRVVTDPAVYRTLRQYEHERRVERTGHRTVHRTKYIRTSHKVTHWHTKCFPMGGCMQYSTTETVTDRKRVTYTHRVSYTYHTTVTDTYWANGRRHQGDTYTGRSKTVLREPAEYGTEYRYQYTVKHAETTTWYPATYHEQISPAQYEWQYYKTTPSRIVVETNTNNPDVRLGGRVPTTVWTLSKPIRYERTWMNGHTDGHTVINTSALVRAKTRVPYVNTATGDHGSVTKVDRYNVRVSGNATVEAVKAAVTDNQTSHPPQ
ncbi:PKD domain-containing protein [Halocalculus aciditolerans]|uniref:PKD/Chitinase domain-containing protein n=1 Tax=Halocalculus aciditolerans TaxID=1383812 RepID=A0A830F2B8_9EURY|nr:PKD domain-containing protein [Halocalculus aciditolerans]GGL55587.1 hypothetical protein GCM10009039_12180 [Halocalculus aciditolerans]